MGNVTLGVIGCGGMGSDLARNAQKLDHATVAVVSDLDESRAKDLAEDIESTYVTDYTELLARDDIDAVLIASPPFMHRQMTEAAAEAGKHVFCEKPMSPTLADCDAMTSAVTEAGVKFQIGHVCRYHGTHGKVRDLVASGDFGAPTTMVVWRIGGGWGDSHPNWRYKLEESGGTLMEVNAHEIDFMRFVCGDVAKVSAIGGTYVQTRHDYPDVTLVSLQFTSGAVGFLQSGNASAIGGYGGRVDCTEGSIDFPAFWGGGATIDTKRFDGERDEVAIGDLDFETPVKAEIRAFVDAILNDTDTPITAADGRAIVEVARAAYRSIEEGGAVISLG